jgi:hypothetical protein
MAKQSAVAIRSEPFPGFDAKVAKVKTLYEGTWAMRNAGKTYLPKFEGEEDEHYEARKSMSVLFNGTKKTVKDMVSRVFEKPIKLSEETDQIFKDWAENIDLEGRDLSSFGASVMESGIPAGIQYIMVDAPAKEEGQTVADDADQNARPYLISLSSEDVLGWKTGKINNETVITQVRIMESGEADDGEFATKTTQQVRVLSLDGDRVKVRIYRKATGSGETESWVQQGPDAWLDIDEITIVPFYANRKAFFKGDPGLDDLADINVAHWQSYSDQRNILHFTRVPILFGAGIGNSEKIKISASQLTKAEDPQAKLMFVEHTGNSIAAGQADLVHLEWMMETHGLQLLVQQSGPQTATGENRNERKETSRLAMMADDLKSALEIAFGWLGKYQGIEFNGNVIVHKDFDSNSLSQPVLTALVAMVQSGKLSKVSFWKEMARRGVLHEDFDIEEEEDLIADEGGEFAGEDGGVLEVKHVADFFAVDHGDPVVGL